MRTNIRTCNGRDEWLRSERTPKSQPCTCGLTFDVTTRSVVYPHVFIPTRAEMEALRAQREGVALEPV
jgi:hypothetical protein